MWIGGLLSLSILGSIYCQSTDVRLPPTITQDPIRQLIYRSDDKAVLMCKAYGIPAVDFEWKKNNMDLNLNLNNIKRLADGTIEINPATSLDQGYYQCIAKNQFGTALSNTSFMQVAIYNSNQDSTVSPKIVTEGDPFYIQNKPVKSVPPPTYMWESAIDSIDTNPSTIALSKRIQVADNGDLYFAYATLEDSLGGRIYKCTTFNEYLDFRAGGSYTSVAVLKAPNGPQKFAPTLGFSSPALTIAVEGREVSLRCFFSGNPEPDIQWSGPKNNLPVGRYQFKDSNSRLTITDIVQADQGDYICTGNSANGKTAHTLQIMVEARPKFLNIVDRPRDTNITEGNSITFNCKAYAIPEATVTWYRNGQPIDVNAPPKRYAFSSDRKSLTIQNLCRNCDDRADWSQSDLGIIQCNASNVHGYAFGAGYVNVLTKTQVTLISADTKVEVEMNQEQQVEFECKAISDPLTPVVPRWWHVDDSKEELMVYNDPPVVILRNETLIIHVVPNNTQAWVKYRGIYKCKANNSYSYAEAIAEITINNYVPPVAVASFADYWWILLLIVLLLLLLIIIICCCCCLLRNRGDKYDVDEKERKNGNDPEKELKTNDFQDYQRPEAQTLRGSRGSLGSAAKLNSDDEASLLEYGDDPGKFTEDGSFVGAYASNTAERGGRGRRE